MAVSMVQYATWLSVNFWLRHSGIGRKEALGVLRRSPACRAERDRRGSFLRGSFFPPFPRPFFAVRPPAIRDAITPASNFRDTNQEIPRPTALWSNAQYPVGLGDMLIYKDLLSGTYPRSFVFY